jgi:uncharacterized protein YegL
MNPLSVKTGANTVAGGTTILAEEVADGSPLLPSQLAQQGVQFGIDPSVINATNQNAQKTGTAWDSITTSSDVLGVDASKLTRPRCYLVMLVLDDSGSISGHERKVVAGAKTFIEQYKNARADNRIHSDVLVAVGTLNRGVIVPYTEVGSFNLAALDTFAISGGTPLYDVANAALTLQIAKTVELQSNGVSAKTLTVLMTDGADVGSKLSSAQLRPVVTGLNERHGNNHLIVGCEVGEAAEGALEQMGIPKEKVFKASYEATSLIDTFSRLSKASMNALGGSPLNGDRPRQLGL